MSWVEKQLPQPGDKSWNEPPNRVPMRSSPHLHQPSALLALSWSQLWKPKAVGFWALSIHVGISSFIFLRKYVNLHCNIQLHIYFIMHHLVDFFLWITHIRFIRSQFCDLMLCRIKNSSIRIQYRIISVSF